MGITAYAQEQLGEVVYVELPAVGRTFAQGEQFGAVESVKAVSDLYCPVGGEVVQRQRRGGRASRDPQLAIRTEPG